MLSDRDRRILHEMERHLSDEERRMVSVTRRARRCERWVRRGADVALVVSGLSALLCFALGTRDATGAGAVAAALFAVLLVARRSPGGRPAAPAWRHRHRFRARRGRTPRR